MLPMSLAAFPVASGMMRLAGRSTLKYFSKYMCLWSAYNNIYQYLSDQDGSRSELLKDSNNKLRTKEINGYLMPMVKTDSETDLILRAINKLDPDQIKEWLELPEVSFFGNRTPEGVKGECHPEKAGCFDTFGQRINGVLNRTRTVDPWYPVYAPIDMEKYESFLNGDLTDIDLLSKQLVMLLYTVRNNLMHGNKMVSSDNDSEVVRMACPILEHLLSCFVYFPKIRSGRIMDK